MKRRSFLLIFFGVSIFATAVTIILAAPIAHASPLFFTNESAFNSAVSSSGIGLTVESFESISDSTAAPFTVGNVTVSPVGTTLVTVFAPSDLGTDGTHIVGWNTGSTGAQMSFTFATPIKAFGVDVIDLGDSFPPGIPGPVPASLTLTMDTGLQLLYSNFTGLDKNVLFAGVLDTDTAFRTVTFQFTGYESGEFLAFDRLQTSAVPEPATMLLLGSGLLGIAGLRRKLRKH